MEIVCGINGLLLIFDQILGFVGTFFGHRLFGRTWPRIEDTLNGGKNSIIGGNGQSQWTLWEM